MWIQNEAKKTNKHFLLLILLLVVVCIYYFLQLSVNWHIYKFTFTFFNKILKYFFADGN